MSTQGLCAITGNSGSCISTAQYSRPSDLKMAEVNMEATRSTDRQTVAAIRCVFNSLVDQNKPRKSYVMERSTYDQYLRILLNTKEPTQSLSPPLKKYSNRTRFKVLYDSRGPYLAKALSNKRVYSKDELFDVIFDAHLRCNHGDGRRTYSEAKVSAGNIFLWQCLLVSKICFCKRTKGRQFRGRSWASPQTYAGELQLLNMEATPDTCYSWLLVYRDDATQYLLQRALKSREPSEIADELLQIFLAHGSPLYLNSSLSRGFISKILSSLNRIWPECPTVFGQQLLCGRQSEFCRMLEEWSTESQSSNWSIGAAFVAAKINGRYSGELGSTPYRLMHRTTLENSGDNESDESSPRGESGRSDEDCANTSGASNNNFMDALATAMALEAENT